MIRVSEEISEDQWTPMKIGADQPYAVKISSHQSRAGSGSAGEGRGGGEGGEGVGKKMLRRVGKAEGGVSNIFLCGWGRGVCGWKHLRLNSTTSDHAEP